MRTLRKIVAGIFLLSLAALYTAIYAIPGVTGALTRTEILQYGDFKVTDSETCYIIRSEKVYAAGHGGALNYYIEDGVQVKKGTRILNVTGSWQRAEGDEADDGYYELIEMLGGSEVTLTDFTSEFNGVVSYYIDGYESRFTPETMRELKHSDVVRLDRPPVNVVRGMTRAGEPVYKICDNREWHMACWVDAGNVFKYSVDGIVEVELPLGQVKALVTDIIEDGDKWLILLRTDRYYEDFTRVRSVQATVVTSNYSGITVRNESMTVNEGRIGVLVKTKSGEFTFRPVKVIATDGDNSLVEVSYFDDDDGNRVVTVNVYDEILRNPANERK